MANRAQVYLVGAGPGDPGLLTLRAAACLARADLVLYDYLANPLVLQHTRAGAELICLGRHGSAPILDQAEVNRRMVHAAKAGRTVVRLKGGDPAVFARAAEEIAALESAGIRYEIVPGITAALAVGSYAGIPLTHGENSSAVALVTGRERADKSGESIDYAALARFPGTLVFYMGVTTARQWSASLIEAGKPPETPVAIVRRCSWPDQQVLRATLADVSDLVASRNLRPPALLIVGTVAALAQERGWFVQRPLAGARIMVTRPREQAAALADLLIERGAEVVLQPAIEIGPPSDWGAVDDAISRLDRVDWLLLSSTNGVRAFLGRLLGTRDLRALGGLKIAAVGSGTAEELARYHLRADLVPEDFRAESLADALAGEAALGRRFLLVRASRGRDVLAERLSQAGGEVSQVVAYENRDVQEADPALRAALAAGQIDWVTVTSSAIATSLVRLFGEDLRHARLASISPITSATLRELGHEASVEAAEFTLDGLVEAICAADGA